MKKMVAVILALMLLGVFTLSVGCTKSEEKKPAEAPAAEKPAEAPAAEKPAEEPAKK